MSWSNPNLRPIAAVAMAAVMAFALGSCGFKPMYGRSQDRVSAAELDSVQIPHLAEREGQLLRNYLMQRFNPDGRRTETRYRLDIGLTKSISNLGVRRDATATRANLSLTANFVLRESTTGKQLYAGKSVSTVSYNIIDDRFAIVAAEQNAVERAAQAVADNLILRISAYLARQKQPS